MKKLRAPEEVESLTVYRGMLIEKRDKILASFGIKFDAAAKFEYKAEEDQAQVSHDEFVSMQLNTLDYVQMRLIEEALDRLNSGDYGVCLSCEQPIPEKRLKALPWARYCVVCQQEMGNRQEEAFSGQPSAINGVR